MQLMEDEIMGEADYEWILAQPSYGEVAIFGRFLERLAMRIHRRLSVRLRGRVQVAGALLQNAAHNLLDIRMWRSWGITVLYGMGLEAPFDTFSLARSLERFCIDVMRRPEAIREAAERLVAGFVLVARIGCAVTRVPRFVIMCHRSSNDFISPRHFGSLAWPSLREICLRLIRAGIVPILHCDGNWDKNVEYFLQLPERRVCLQFDGRTDIFRASEILGNHCILFGDVPAAMLVMGAPHEIDEYCRRLIGSLGKDGGYILGAGCEIPSDAKAANVHAMIRAARKYGYYG